MVSILLYLVARIEPRNYAWTAVLCGMAVAALTYLRPNLVLLLCLPVVVGIHGTSQTPSSHDVRWHRGVEHGNDAFAMGTFHERPFRSISRPTLYTSG